MADVARFTAAEIKAAWCGRFGSSLTALAAKTKVREFRIRDASLAASNGILERASADEHAARCRALLASSGRPQFDLTSPETIFDVWR